MRKLPLLLVILAGFFCNLSAQVKFEEFNWEQLQKKSIAENKLLMVDMTATWCGWCKVMDKKVFSNIKVGDFYSKHFISTKLYDTHVSGPEFAKKYGVDGLPTLLFLNSEGKLVYKIEGAITDVEEFLLESAKALEKKDIDPKIQEKIEDKEELLETCEQIIELAEQGDKSYQKKYAQFLKTKEAWTTEEGQFLTLTLVTLGDAEALKQFKLNRAKLKSNFGEDLLEEVLLQGSYNYCYQQISEKDDVKKLEKKVINSFNKYFDGDKSTAMTRAFLMLYYFEKREIELSIAEVYKFVPPAVRSTDDKEKKASAYEIAADVLYNLAPEDKKHLQQAIDWLKKGEDILPSNSIYELFVIVYQALGQEQEANKYRILLGEE